MWIIVLQFVLYCITELDDSQCALTWYAESAIAKKWNGEKKHKTTKQNKDKVKNK